MAEVFLAAHRGPVGFEKLVVIKRLKAGVATDPELLEMFLDEARIAARLNHPNVVQTYEAGTVDEQQYLAMEYLDGQPLDRVIHRIGRGPLEAYLVILADALAGLHHAHELVDYDGAPLMVVHRDVSPHNIFVTYEGQAKVVDFGIAKSKIRSAETSTGVVKGKIAYMAPEQALSSPVDRRADLFAVGVILWEVAAGERLWGSLSEVQILQKMTFGELPRIEARRPDAPPELARICARALAMAPADRYATAAEMREDLEALIASLGRRPTAAEIGALVGGAFEDRRAETKAVIGAQLAQIREAPAEADLPGGAEDPARARIDGGLGDLPMLDDRAGPPSARGRSAPSREAVREATPGAAVAGPEATPAPAPRRWFTAAALLGAAAAGAALFAALRGGVPPWPATPALGAEAAPPATSEAASARLIELRITATPTSARILLDDAPVPSNPFAAKFLRDGTGHRIRVEADGYAPEARLVVFERDVSLDVALAQAGAAPSGAAPPPSRPARSAGSDAPRKPGPPEAAVTPVGVVTAATTASRGPKVDTSDPWGKRPGSTLGAPDHAPGGGALSAPNRR